MATDTLSRLYGPAQPGSGTVTLFTVTTSHVYTIRSIRIVNNGTTAITVKVGIGGVTDALLILPTLSIPPANAYHDDGLFVLTGAETFQVNSSASGLTITVSGLDQLP
jgi:hypothetical protein